MAQIKISELPQTNITYDATHIVVMHTGDTYSMALMTLKRYMNKELNTSIDEINETLGDISTILSTLTTVTEESE